MRIRGIATLLGATVVAGAATGCGASQPTTTSSTAAARNAAATTSAAATSAGEVEGWGRYAGNNRPDGGAPGSRDATRAQRGHGHRGEAVAGGGRGMARFTPTEIQGIPGRVIQIATSNSDSYALTSGGAVYAVGAGLAGELGDGSTPRLATQAVRVHLPAGVRIAHLSDPMPYDAGMVIDTHGNVWAWGNDANQEFCRATPGNISTPVQVSLHHVSLAVGAQRHAIYDSDGHVVSCGLGADGQLGNGSGGAGSQTGTPVAVRGLPAGRVTELTSGYGNAGVVMAGGAYYDWGLNNHGQVGDGSRTMATTARRVSLPGPVATVSEGGSITSNGQAMALLRDGSLYEWGAGHDGQLGNGSTADALTPIHLAEPSGVHFVKVASGGATDFAITQTDQLWDWGSGAQGELGNGSRTPKQATRPTRTSLHVSQVSSTAANVVALTR